MDDLSRKVVSKSQACIQFDESSEKIFAAEATRIVDREKERDNGILPKFLKQKYTVSCLQVFY